METMPKFEHDVPAVIYNLAKDDLTRYQLEEASVARQQNEWIMQRLVDGEIRFTNAEIERKEFRKDLDKVEQEQVRLSQRIEPFETMKERMTGRWSVIAFLFVTLIIPLFLVAIGEAFKAAFHRLFN